MGSRHWIFALLCGVGLFGALAPSRSDARQLPPEAAGHFTHGVEPLVDFLTTQLDSPSLDVHARALYQTSLASLASPSGSVGDDITSARKVMGRHKQYKNRVPDGFGVLFLSALAETTRRLRDSVAYELTAFEEKIDEFERSNPQVSIKRQRSALAKAKYLLDKSNTRTNESGAALTDLLRSDLQIQKVLRFDYVPTPPKKCGGGWEPGQYCRGSFQGVNPISGAQESFYFQANSGAAGTRGAATDVAFYYCTGDDHDLVDLHFTLVGPGPTFQIDGGGFKQGKNGFGGSLQASSTVTITSGAVTGGVLEGTFKFSASTGSGSGEFRVYVGL